MATILTTTYNTDAPLAVTAWGTSLLAGETATSAIYDNTTTQQAQLLLAVM